MFEQSGGDKMAGHEDLMKVQDLIKCVVSKTAGTQLTREEFDEVVQDVNVKMLSGGLRLYREGKGKFSTWTHKIARGVVLDYLRNRGRRPKCSISIDEEMDNAPEDRGPKHFANLHLITEHLTTSASVLEKMVKEEQYNRLLKAISRLSPLEQEILAAYSNGEMAEYIKASGMDQRAIFHKRKYAVKKLACWLQRDIKEAS